MTLIHEAVNDPDADVSFRFADGIVFRIHRANLNITAGGFPPNLIPNPMREEYVDLTETAGTLGLLFGFVYPKMRKTTLEKMKFEFLALLAEAAEKYEVFVAMDVCLVQMTYVPINNHEVPNVELLICICIASSFSPTR